MYQRYLANPLQRTSENTTNIYMHRFYGDKCNSMPQLH